MVSVSAKQMKQMELESLKYGLSYADLMENAGRAASLFLMQTFGTSEKIYLFFCGKANNGGDGFVAARYLHQNGAAVVVMLVEGKPTQELPLSMMKLAHQEGVSILPWSEDTKKIKELIENSDVVVDAIYGTGFHGELVQNAAIACQLMNDSLTPVVSLDLPTGVTCDEGIPSRLALRADYTLCFGAYKPVHELPSSKPYCAKTILLEIGLPTEVLSMFDPIDANFVWNCISPRNPESNKGVFGKVLCLCGSERYRGAAVLSATGVLRTGAGLCMVASIPSVCHAVSTALPEAVFLPLVQTEQGIDFQTVSPQICKELASSKSVLFGCGMGNSEQTASLLKLVLENNQSPMVLDADGLNVLEYMPDTLLRIRRPLVLTPHPGEMARLLHTDVTAVQENRQKAAQELSMRYRCVVVLKGHHTVIADENGVTRLCPVGNPGLATGGSGDLLAGMIASFLAQGLSCFDAAACGVWLHGTAADRCAMRLSQAAMLPSDIIFDLQQLFLENHR